LYILLLDFHSLNIVHRDIKLENIIFANKETFKIKLIDFGIGYQMKEANFFQGLTSGTLGYMCPELLNNGL